jgi:Domain of unknown function (DUF397)
MQDSHPPSWRKSSASASGDCVEVAFSSGLILVRDSKSKYPRTLKFAPSRWQAFLSDMRAGEFDIDDPNPFPRHG